MATNYTRNDDYSRANSQGQTPYKRSSGGQAPRSSSAASVNQGSHNARHSSSAPRCQRSSTQQRYSSAERGNTVRRETGAHFAQHAGSVHAGYDGAQSGAAASRQRQRAAGESTSVHRGYEHQGASQFSRDSYADGRVQEHRNHELDGYAKRHQGTKPSAAPSKLRVGVFAGILVAVFALVMVLHPFGLGADSSSETVSSGSDNTIVGASGATSETASFLPTPIIAQSSGIDIHSAVSVNSLTEILIHNASYSYALPLTTELIEATNTEVMANHGTGRDKTNQPMGDEWLTGEFIRCYRSSNAGPTLSAIDCGGPVGAQVYAPVSGTVVLVKEYLLYDQYEDIQIHIQPEGRDDLDVVLIHLTDATVEAGDEVVAGVTPIASIRDVYAYIGDEMQLKDYTAEDDNGNHTHIQVNDATDPDYHGLDDLKTE